MATPKINIELDASVGVSGLQSVSKELEGVTAKAKEAAKELQNVSSAASGGGDGQSWRQKVGEDENATYYQAGSVSFSVEKPKGWEYYAKDAEQNGSEALSDTEASDLADDADDLNESLAKVQKKGIFKKLSEMFKHMADEFNEGRKEARAEWAAKNGSASGKGASTASSGGMDAAKKSSEELNKSLKKTNDTMKKSSDVSAKSSTAFKHLGNAAKTAAKGLKALAATIGIVTGVVTGLIGVLAGLAVALAGPLAILAKFNERMGEAQKYRLALGDLGNEQKRTENAMAALGYESEALRDKWIDLEIELEKLRWENQYLTENDIKIEEGIKNLQIAIGSITGTIVDWIGTMINDLFPTLDDLQTWCLEYAAPAIATLATVFTNFGDTVDAACAYVELSFREMADNVVYFFSDYIPEAIKYFLQNFPQTFTELATNILKLFENIGTNIFAAIEGIGEWIYKMLPESWQDAFSDIRTMFDNFLFNVGEFAGSIIAYFFEIPTKLGTFGQNFIQFFKNVFSKISELFKKMMEVFTWENIKDMIWNRRLPDIVGMFKEVDWSDLTTAGMEKDTSGGFGEYAHYRNILEGIATDEEREKKRKERGEKRPKFTSLTEGMEWSAWDDFKAPEKKESEATQEARRRFNEAMGRWSQGYNQNLATTRAFMSKNFKKEGERLGDNAVRPMGPAELLKLLEGSSKASTEGLTSAYDRINNAVANKNPMIDLLKKQIEAQKQAAEQQKKTSEKQAEATEKQAEHNSVVEEKVTGIFNWLTTGTAKAPAAAVVEG